MMKIFLELKEQLLQKTQSLITLTLTLWMVCSTTFLTAQEDSLRCFTVEESKTLLKYAEKGYLCDSLMTLYDGKIETLEQIIGKKDQEILLSAQLIQSQLNEIDKYIRREKWFKLGLGVLSGALIVFVIF